MNNGCKYRLKLVKKVSDPVVEEFVEYLISLLENNIINLKIIENYMLFTTNMDFAFNKYGLTMSLVNKHLEEYGKICESGSKLLFTGVIEIQKYTGE